MSEDDALERRLAAVERAIDGKPAVESRETGADAAELEGRVADLEARVDDIDAAVQAIRGFLGGVSAVNESVERRADAAVAAVERLERRLDDDAPAADPEPANYEPEQTDGAEATDDREATGGKEPTDGAEATDDTEPTDDAGNQRLRGRLQELQ